MNTQYRKNLKAVLEASKSYCDESINNLKWELGTYDLSVESDTDVAYQKTIPSGAIDCMVNSLGGMSYKVNQLVANGNFESISGWTVGGATATTSNNKVTITSNGAFSYPQISRDIDWKQNHKYLLITGVEASDITNIDGFSIGNSQIGYVNVAPQTKFTMSRIIDYGTNTNTGFVIYGLAHQSTDVITFTLSNTQVFDLTADFGSGNEPSTISDCYTAYLQRGINIYEYTPQQSAIRDTAITSVKSVGVNVMGLENVAETTRNGVTYSVNNGVISLNGTVTSGFELKLYFDEIAGGTYSSLLSINKTGSVFTDSLWLIANGTSYNLGRANGATNTLNISDKSNYIRTWLYGNESFANVQIKITLIKGSTAPTTYIPYFSDTLAIDSNIQALNGYGWGINDNCYNYIDFENKKFIQKVGRVDLGTLNWTSYGSITNAYWANVNNIKIVNSSTLPNIICARYTTATRYDISDGTDDKLIGVHDSQLKVIIKDSSFTSASDLSGVYLYYELETPVETDISQYIDDGFINVEENGTLTFTSTYNQAVPSDVDYLKEVAK